MLLQYLCIWQSGFGHQIKKQIKESRVVKIDDSASGVNIWQPSELPVRLNSRDTLTAA